MTTGLQGVVLVGVMALLAGCAQPHGSGYSAKYTAQYNSGYTVPATATAATTRTFTPIEAKYNEAKSPAWNFANALNATVMQCSREASTGYLMYGVMRSTGNSRQPDDYAQVLLDCSKFAHQKGSEAVARLKQAKVSPELRELAKDLYAKWSTYIASMSVYSPKNTTAQVQFETALRALHAEDQFSQ